MFTGKTVVVSGVGPGLGVALAKQFTREKANVVVASRTAEYLDSVASELQAAGGRALAVVTDITRSEDCERLRRAVLDAFGGVDVLVNNAFSLGAFEQLCDVNIETQWQPAFDVNVTGTLRLVQAMAPALSQGEGGAIVNINTFRFREPRAGSGAYCASKGALQNLSRTLAIELGPRKIRVNNVIPGYIESDSLRAYFETTATAAGTTADAVADRILATLPLGFIPNSEQVGEAVLFLASDRAAAITGASLDVNAGMCIP